MDKNLFISKNIKIKIIFWIEVYYSDKYITINEK